MQRRVAVINVEDTTDRLAWGWIAIIHNLTAIRWMRPTEAARYLDVPTWKLRYWADQGVITCINNERGHHRRYLAPELETIRYLMGKYPTLLGLKWYVADAVKARQPR